MTLQKIGHRVRKALKSRSPVVRYGAAVLLAVLAQAARTPLDPPSLIPFITYIPFIALSGAFGGLGPGLLTTSMALLQVTWFALEPRGSLLVTNRQEMVGLAALAMSGAVISYLFQRSKQAAEVQELQRELAALLDGTYDAAFVWQPDGTGISWWNHAAERLYLYSRADAIGKASHKLLQTVFPVNRDEVESALRGHGVWEGELIHTAADGRRIRVESHMAARRGRDGALRVLQVNRDVTDRRKEQEQLSLEVNFRRLAFDAAGLGAWDYNFRTGEVFWDERSCEFFGVAPGDAIVYGQVLDRIHEDDRPAVDEATARALRGEDEGSFHREFRVVQPDGTLRSVEAHGRAYFNGEGLPLRFIGVNIDITERRRAEGALRTAMEELRAIHASAPVTFLVVDEELRARSVSDVVSEHTSETPVPERELLPGDFLGCRNTVAAGCGAAPACHMCQVRRLALDCIADGVRHEAAEAWIPVMKDGREQERCYVIAVTPMEIGSRKALVCLQDITALRQAELELQQHRETLLRQAHLMNLSQDAIITTDAKRNIIGWNTGAEEMYGWTASEATGRPVHSLLQTRAALTVSGIDALLQKTGRYEAEIEHTRKDETKIIVETRQVLVRGQDGAPNALLEINRDITERRRAEEEIRKLNGELEARVRQRTAQLEASNKELEAFAYSVSHDLRAPLRGIDGWSLALLEDYGAQLNGEARSYLGRVRSETQHMGKLIDDLLQLSRVTRSEMKTATVDLTRLAHAVADRLREHNPGRQVEFAIQPELTAVGDEHLLEIALTNLLGNAVKFTGTRPQARIEVGFTGENGHSTFFVRDNGVGFDMAYADSLFGAFQRLHKPSDFPGTGIGLATVQRIIRRHGGRVWAEAQPEQGATFYFVLENGRAGVHAPL